MQSWIYIFSKFTPEALLFEALAIFALVAGYAAFWVLRKRRYGALKADVPAPIAKAYLNQLIREAEQVRAQLFGLLTGTDSAPLNLNLGAIPTTPAPSGDVSQAMNAEMTARYKQLEEKVTVQAQTVATLSAEKANLVKELEQAKAAASVVAATAAAGGPADQGTVSKLQEKIGQLEGRLAEYSVIEDDLANLKRLQMENAQLKSMLEGKGVAAPAPAPEAAPAAAPEAPAPAAAEAAPAADAPTAAVAAGEPSFEGLVSQVSESLDTPEPAVEAAPAAEAAPAPEVPAEPAPAVEAAPAAPAPAVAAAASGEKSDAELVAEFEKMLNA